MSFERKNFYGLIFHWYAVDANDCIAKFISGFGIIPKRVFADEEIYKNVDDYFEDLLPERGHTLSTFAESMRRRSLAKDNSIWNEADKGLFIYDERNYGPNYDLLSLPKNPLRFSQQPEIIKSFLSEFIIPKITFTGKTQINPEIHFECV